MTKFLIVALALIAVAAAEPDLSGGIRRSGIGGGLGSGHHGLGYSGGSGLGGRQSGLGGGLGSVQGGFGGQGSRGIGQGGLGGGYRSGGLGHGGLGVGY
ncbi:unnamed protein product [Parnassius apollo]|uniref:(apollo) hypothetical protein n=1 Tax=Parnassius apollo TaxID=110799 RepID=A0A8S3XZA3_PARAO|nr:unnamed protein product [Parnassius apollo]